ncbi:MAG: formate dehydrogenase accessory sulfurtransferase FdhD [Rhodobacteraceae bacterium]|nr:formate dehydrogenase accessory sulfurtransferase FdhD [Paracoccaceae bacterium]
MTTRRAESVPCLTVRSGAVHSGARALPEETPVAIVYNGTTQAVMMATPDDLEDFAVGFSLTEHVITDPAQIERMEIVEHGPGIEARLWLTEDRAAAMTARRRAMAGPVGCGLCGIDSLEEALHPVARVPASALRLTVNDVLAASEGLRAAQPLHDQTRAVHAAGFYRPGTGLMLSREDVGRHNALDKLIGAMLRGGIDATTGAIVLTSRVSVEMVQKCAVAGAPVLIAASAPTAHALRLAEGAGLTIAALVRDGGFSLFSHPSRIDTGASQNVA